MSILKISRVSFSLSVMAFGLLHFVLDHMAGRPATESFVAFTVIGFFFRILLISFAFGLMVSDKPHVSATSLGVLLLAWTCIRHFPLLITNINDPGEWNSTGMAIAMAGGAFMMANSFPKNTPKHSILFRSRSFRDLPISFPGRFLFGVPMCIFGMQHLLYSDFIASLIPSWIPQTLFWAYGTGCALIVAGCCITLGIKIRWTGILLGTMLLLWLTLVHFPKIMAEPKDVFEWTNAFQACALCACAFVLSNTLKMQADLHSAAASKVEKMKVNILVSKMKKSNATRTLAESSPSRQDITLG